MEKRRFPELFSGDKKFKLSLCYSLKKKKEKKLDKNESVKAFYKLN